MSNDSPSLPSTPEAALQKLEREVEALRREVERLRLLARNERGLLDAVLNHSSHGVIVSDAHGQLILHNRAAERIWAGSATATTVAGWGKYRAFHPDGRPFGEGDWAMARCLSNGETMLAEETHFQRFDDTHGVVLGSCAPICDEHGVLTGAVSVFADVTEQVRARERAEDLARSLSEQQAARSEIELRKEAILAGALDCIIAIDSDGRTTDFNPAAERMFARTRAEVLGQEMAELIIPPALREMHRRGLRRYVETREAVVVGRRIELEALRADGSLFPVELAIAPIAVEGGVAFTGYLRDITERRTGEAERAELLTRERAARASLRTTLNSIGDAVIAADADGVVTYMNPVGEGLTGWTLAEAIGQPLTRVFSTLDARTRKALESPMARVVRGGSVALGEHTLLARRDGSEIAIDERGSPIRDDDGVLTGAVLVFRDVTAAKRESERRDFLLDVTPALSSVLDAGAMLTTLARQCVPRIADWCAVDMVDEDGATTRRTTIAHVDPKKVHLAADLDRLYPPDPDAATGVPNVVRTGISELYEIVPDELLAAAAVDAEHLRILRDLFG